MNNFSPPPPRPPEKLPIWGVIAVAVGFIAAFALWSVGFHYISTAISGGIIETALNWLSRFWLAVAIGVIVLASLFGHRDR